MSSPPLKDLVEEWIALDPNPETRKEIQDLWDSRNVDELEKRLRTRIEFGTAGLRGRMEAGWSRMNDLIILQTSQGLSDYVLEHVKDAHNRGLVVGYDHRHHSEHWAQLTAGIFISKGIKVYLLRGFNHTPMVPFSVKQLGAACGVMITASHNPKQDNGYKVYWENAVQIIGPHDDGISKAITSHSHQGAPASQLDIFQSNLLVDMTKQLQTEYFEYLGSLLTNRELNSDSGNKFVNTSMHGVGDYFVKEGFSIFGFPSYTPVIEQQQPDPEFPTVKFPNPEEKGALDLALATAEREGINYVLAQDPDADRFTAAERRATGGWTLFTGDQLGSLFASRVFETYKASGKPIEKLAMVASTVSSKMIQSMADVEGFKFEECLTGFKFIGNTALRLVDQGFDVPFGYEEAIGYMFGSQVRDKDGVAATMLFGELIAALRRQGETVEGHLEKLYKRYGYFQTSNSYFTCTDPKITDKIFARLRKYNVNPSLSGAVYPKTLAGLDINRVIDLTTGYDSGNPPTYKPSLPLSSGHMIQIRAGNQDTSLDKRD
ncbi:putative phosphoribomutase [Psilocybe cubensis]|uniref:Phosphoribomutase n=2 Tax=Psilocybe cubensis TaxID=181762 RepID=A0ACB8H806_PSICU|nr:putative phosphoribomutase [Psilocybe cubensis]KAH9483817.1 putative phosphoribomutase [Psilocybe cubensis]